MIGSEMLLRCVDLKLLKVGERFKMNTCSLKTDKDVAEFLLDNYIVQNHFFYFLLCTRSSLLHLL